MNGDVIILLTIGISILVMAIAETHIAFVTLALCGGYVLTQFAGPDALNLLDNYVDPESFPLFEAVHVALLLLPALLVGIRFRRTQRGMKRFISQIVPGLAMALLLTVFLVDIVPEDVTARLREESYLASTIVSMSSLLVVFAISAALFDVLVKHANEPDGKKRGPGRPRKS